VVKEEEEEEKSPSSPASRAIPAQQRQSIEENRIWLSLLFFARSPATAAFVGAARLSIQSHRQHTHTPRSLISILFLFSLLCVGNRVGSRAIAVQQHPQLRPFCRFFLSLVSAPSPSLVCGQKQKDIGARNNQDIKTLLLIGSSVFIWHQKKKKKSIHWDLSAGNHLDKGKED
jgi:hypothetical protein